MVTEIWVNIGPGNGLLPDGTKSLPDPMLTNYKLGLMAFSWHEIAQDYISLMHFKNSQFLLQPHLSGGSVLTHWGRATHICIGKLTIIGSDNGLSPGRHQTIIWTNAGILLIGPLGTNFSEILIKILIFSFKKMRLKVSSAKWRLFCLGLSVLTYPIPYLFIWTMAQYLSGEGSAIHR